ncbi:MAG: OmpA family protein [Halomonas sp.]|nr:OmpA family protein [Halomonas sp.]TVM04906.1 MAG: OmpA family protein [Halomonas sp.]
MSKTPLAAVIVALFSLTGCASTESLYAEYDAFCTTEPHVVTITEDNTRQWEPAVYFGFDEAVLNAAQRQRLDHNLALLKEHPELQLSVRAFTDQRGSQAYNRELSERRRQAVVAYLTEQGLAPSRMRSTPAGKQAPILDSMAVDDRVINRRVEMLLLDAQGRPLVLSLDPDASGGDNFTPPTPVE